MIKRPIIIITSSFFLLLMVVFLAPKFFIPISFLLGIASSICVFVFGKIKVDKKKMRVALLFTVCTVISFILINFHYKAQYEKILSLQDKEEVLIEYEVLEQVSNFGDGEYFIWARETEGKLRFKAKFMSAQELTIGSKGVANVKLSTPKDTVFFENRAYLEGKGIFLEAKVIDGDMTATLSNTKAPMSARIKEYIKFSLERFLGQKADLITAVLLAERTHLSDGLSRKIAYIGMMHMITLSGARFFLMDKFAVNFLKFLGVRRKGAVFVSFLVTLGLILTFRSTPSLFRAGFMMLSLQIGILINRRRDFLTSLFLSALAILLYNPFLLKSASFTMSYTATLAIYLLNPKIRLFLNEKMGKLRENRVIYNVLYTLCISATAFLSLLPWTIYYYGRASLLSIFGTLLFMPLIYILIFLGIILLFFARFRLTYIIAKIIAEIILGLTAFITKIVDAFYAIPLVNVRFRGSHLKVVIISTIIIFLMLYYLNRSKKIKFYFAKFMVTSFFVLLLSQNIFNFLHRKDIYFICANNSKSDSFMVFDRENAYIILQNPYRQDGKLFAHFLDEYDVKNVRIAVLNDDRFSGTNSLKDIIEWGGIPAVMSVPEGAVEGADTHKYMDGQIIDGDVKIITRDAFSLIDFKGESFSVRNDAETLTNITVIKEKERTLLYFNGEYYEIISDKFDNIIIIKIKDKYSIGGTKDADE